MNSREGHCRIWTIICSDGDGFSNYKAFQYTSPETVNNPGYMRRTGRLYKV